MRILHTADLHLGRQFNGLALEDDHAAVLDQIVATIREHRPRALVIAGDIFDRAVPPASAVRQFNGFLARVVAETEAAVVLLAGNHDQADRIGAMALLSDPRRALIRGPVQAAEPPLILSDAQGPVAISALPFAHEHAARAAFGDETLQSPEAVLAAQVAAARAEVPGGARWVIAAHAFVSGAVGSEGERPLTRVGGIETVRPEIFAGATYVALGHLHRPQTVGLPTIRYAGAPLAFGFDEAGHDKSMSLVTLDGAGGARGTTVTPIPFRPRRRLRSLTGRHADLMREAPSEDFFKVVLTDQAPVIDAMKRLRAVFPNTCDLSYARVAVPRGRARAAPTAETDPLALVTGFVAAVRDAPSAAERQVLASALARIGAEGDAP